MKTLSTLALCAFLMPVTALGMDSPPEEPEQQNRAAERSQQQRDTTMGGAERRDQQAKRDKRKEHSANLDTTADGFLNSTPSLAVSVENLMGSSVRNRAGDEEIGNVEDILIDHKGQPLALVVSVGGFLGIGEKDVALSWKQVRVAYVEDDGGWFESDDSPGAGTATGTAGRQNAGNRRGAVAEDWSPGDYVIIVDTTRDALENAPEFDRDWND